MEKLSVLDKYEIKKSKFISAKGIISATISFLLGRASIFGIISPFGLAYLAGYIDNYPEKSIQAVVISIIALIGVATMGADILLIKYTLAFVLFGLIYIAVTTLSDSRRNYTTSAIASISLLISGIIFNAQTGFASYNLIMLFLECAVCFVFSVIAKYAIPIIHSTSEHENTQTNEIIAFYILAAISVLGFTGLTIFGIGLGNSLAALFIMIVALIGGVSIGATGGMGIGIIASFQMFPMTETLGIYGFCGLVSGLMSKYKKAGIILGFTIANSILSLYFGGFDGNIFSIYEILIAIILFCLVPPSLIIEMERLISIRKYETITANKYLTMVTKKINNISASFEHLANFFTTATQSTEKDNLSDITILFDKTADKVCRRCGLKFVCWEKEFNSTYDTMCKLTPVLYEKGNVEFADVAPYFANKCVKITEFLHELNKLYVRYKLDLMCNYKFNESKELVSQQLYGVCKIMNNLACEIDKKSIDTTNTKELKENFSVLCSGVKISKDGQTVCGDSYNYQRTPDGKYIIALSDGMGFGDNAYSQSGTAVEMIKHLLSAGFEKNTAIKMINSVLLIRNNKETFATMDIAIIDLFTGKIEFLKTGANASYIKRGKKVEKISVNSLPVGILNNVDMEIMTKNAEIGNYIIMLSDGVHSVCDDWLCDFLANMEDAPPQTMAEKIIDEATRRKSSIDDDMTIIVAQLKGEDELND